MYEIYHAGDGELAERPLYFCTNGSMIELEKLCDGNNDCVSGTDETNVICQSK